LLLRLRLQLHPARPAESRTLSLHDALPICGTAMASRSTGECPCRDRGKDSEMTLTPFRFVHATNVRLDQPLWGIGAVSGQARHLDRKSTRLNSSHVKMSYAVFCLKNRMK